MTPRELNILTGMVNCFRVCHEYFENTVWMVAARRDLKTEEVKKILFGMKGKYGEREEYIALRKKLPQNFPV